MKFPWSRALALAVVASVGSGCSHGNGHGESVQAALRAQAAPAKKRTNAVEGLDSQEAAIVARSYHKSLAPKDVKASPYDEVILVGPTNASGTRGAPPPLAPSVPPPER
jgi:hypothetical protein